jgi:hypothetical protein
MLFAVEEFKFAFKKVVVPFNLVKLLAFTFADTPPPVKYLNVKVVFEGAIP